MKNSETEYAVRYHEGTKHSEISVRTSGHPLDWENKPAPFKVYEGLPSMPLPRDFPGPGAGALESLSPAGSERVGELSAEELAELLFFSAGLTRKVRYGGGDAVYLRAASATGALYPIEVYVVSSDIRGLGAGVYHFDPLGFALTRLREGDHRAALASASGESVGAAPVTIAFTSLAWRNAWKYQARSYRHWFWDAGVMVANLLSVASAMGTEARVVEGFVDADVNRLLGVRENKEAAVVIVPLGAETAKPGSGGLAPHPINPVTRPLSNSELHYPEIWEMHGASSLRTLSEVRDWTGVRCSKRPDAPLGGAAIPLKRGSATEEPRARLGDVILRRGSTRRFALSPVRFSDLSAILLASTTAIPSDFLAADESLIDVYLVVNDVDGLPAGAYFFDSKAGLLRELKRGGSRLASAYLCLEQPLFGSASVVFFLMTPLGDVLGAYGNRGYRAAQLEGGIRAGKMYLSAYALGLGASGSTFYDDAVTEFFSPHSAGKACVVAVGVGVPAYRARPGRVLPQFS